MARSLGALDVLVRQVQGMLGGGRIGPLRSTGTVSCAGAGASTAIAVDTSGVATPDGVMVVHVGAASHLDFRWFPNDTSGIVVVNDGATQNIRFSYRVTGT